MNASKTIADKILHDPELMRRVVAYDFSMYEEGEADFIKEQAKLHNVADADLEDVYYALRLVRGNYRANF